MSLRLILTRHAKSSWDDPTADDHERPLNGRGRRSARAIGAWLAQQRMVPALVISSDALRTRQTWEEIEAELQSGAAVRWEPALYHATPQTILDVLQGAGSETPVMLIGHNPGIALAARAFADRPPRHTRFERYPTGATTIFDFAVERWDGAGWGGGTIAGFSVPRDLGVA